MFAEKLMLINRIIVALLFCPLLNFAQPGAENVVVLEEPNTLSDVADTMMVTWAYKLTIKGPMSNDDLKFLNDALLVFPDNKYFDEYIQWLDLSETQIMPLEGAWRSPGYYDNLPFAPFGRTPGHRYFNFPTPEDEIPNLCFAGARSLHHIQLPKVRFIEMGFLYQASTLEELVFQEGLDSLARWVGMGLVKTEKHG